MLPLTSTTKAMAFLHEESRIKRMLETFHSEIPGLVADFNGHADKLSRQMEVETLVTVKKILDQQTESFDQIGNRNADEDDRSDEACHWIIFEENFEDWAYGPHGVLTMYGVVGCGKTSTAAYVTKYLREEARAPVLAYYCTQQEDDELRLILCSLTYQLLQAKTELKEKFKDWSEKRQAVTLDKPSNKPAVLAEFLCSSLQNSREQVFIVLDGLDECEEDVRSALLVLFRDLISNGAMVKLFVSSRQRDDILQTLSSSETTEEAHQIPLFHIDMKPTEERDRVLAKHLAAKPLRQIQDNRVREKAIEQLAKQARGSAIWLHMAMASLAGAKNEHRIEKCLEFLQTDPRLVDWYERLFRDAESATCNDREILERALETLAVARRPMTIDELARAANIDDAENGESLLLLNEAAEEIDFLSLIRPFVATLDESANGKALRVRLVHQSLLELLLTARPSEWEEMATTKKNKRVTAKEKEQRRRDLNEQLMARCVKYLLLDDLEDGMSDDDPHTPSEIGADTAQENEEPWDGFGFGDMFAEPVTQKRTRTRAQISHLHFYEYAASYWVNHFAACEKDATNNLKKDASKLLDFTASECTDWVSFVRTEKEAQGEIFPKTSEPASLAAYFGLGETLAGILADDSTVLPSTKDGAVFWSSRGGYASIVKLLLENGADPNQHIADEHTALTIAAHRGHLGCVQALLTDQRTDLNVEGTRSRTALSFAAGNGHEKICAALVQRKDCRLDDMDWKGMTPLFYAAGSEHVSIVKALATLPGVNVNHQENSGRTTLSRAAEGRGIAPFKQLLDTEGVNVNLPDNDGMTPLMWAAFMGNAAGTEELLRHAEIDKAAVSFKDKKNAIHFACQTGMHEVLMCLLKHDCPGIDDPDVDGWTPMMWAIQNGPECVSTLLATGQVEIERRDNEGRSVLSQTAQWGSSIEVIRILLHHGADPGATDNNGQTSLDVAMKRGLSVGFMMADELSAWLNKKRGEHNQPLQSTR
ncbi:ankyrin repeat-containing domain protein [Diaporthe sp. PMI_573]|nr:ankyrin repeat-containing domain protein [Diaporthaceae sp. PMI_573]